VALACGTRCSTGELIRCTIGSMRSLCALLVAACGSAVAPGGDASIDAGRDAGRDAHVVSIDAFVPNEDAGPPVPPSVLVFSRTQGFPHDSIPTGIEALRAVATERGWTFDATADSARITDSSLADVDVLVFLCTTGDMLDGDQQDALQRFIRAGGGWVGIHAAADAEYDWPWYGELVGAWFRAHPAIQEATLTVDTTNPITAHLPSTWSRTDEWYDFRRNPREFVTVLMTIDESTYTGGTMGSDHPMTWMREYDGGRSFYTELGHTSETYGDAGYRRMLANAIEWAAQSP
jgi:type 1 glutamine amidotransferase